MSDTSRQSGFTIVELMVTLAVAAILMGFAVPAFNDFVRQRTAASHINDFVLAVTYARSEAARRGVNVSLEARGNENDNEWGEGYDVMVDPGGADEEILRSFEAVADGFTMNAVGNGWDGEDRLTYSPRGLITPQPPNPGQIQLCHETEDPGRVVNVTVIGRPDVEELTCN
ncbi:MAG: prepilin-type N-terminal cleavage/methylation domain-containing protein [Gammaproteobacteria bacterium]|jgi:type IV fimbrial biogenesis protein FimT|nr:prepilin-type N-terminal cleavage/methylation domain-containing protein [Gammaproteobacteria bacterium]